MDTINIGNPYEITVKELAGIITNMIECNSKIVYMDLPSNDPMKRNPDITKAKKFLNWEPKVDLKIGLEKTIEYFSNI